MRKVKCPDGKSVFVFKDPRDAFQTLVYDTSLQLAGDVALASEIAAKLQAELSTTARNVATQLDEVNRSMYSTFHSIYVVYQHDPCGKGDYLAEEVRKANEREHQLRRVSVALLRLKDLIASGATEVAVSEVLREAMTVLKDETTREIQIEMKHTAQRALTWDED